MGVVGMIPEVDQVDSEVTLGLCNPEDALVQIGPEGRRKECQDGAMQGLGRKQRENRLGSGPGRVKIASGAIRRKLVSASWFVLLAAIAR